MIIVFVIMHVNARQLLLVEQDLLGEARGLVGEHARVPLDDPHRVRLTEEFSQRAHFGPVGKPYDELHVCICIYVCMCMYVCMYIYIYIERERESASLKSSASAHALTLCGKCMYII